MSYVYENEGGGKYDLDDPLSFADDILRLKGGWDRRSGYAEYELTATYGEPEQKTVALGTAKGKVDDDDLKVEYRDRDGYAQARVRTNDVGHLVLEYDCAFLGKSSRGDDVRIDAD
ncbi:hypothetical protein ACQPZG_32550 [Streptomyces sp. CA-294286]|uniref:hypothetical protein n=1 Tax=Streptomyces sp. CA-294286 TaxID=3240070 RepID=UPI003D923415